MINWNATKAESDIIHQIIDRYYKLDFGIPRIYKRSRLDLEMDIEAVHCNGNPLRLADLLNADNLNFAHDIIGIQQNLNRNNGQLMNCFVPRYSA